ncbi:MAG: sensor histidine kinase [Bacilli bacterium]
MISITVEDIILNIILIIFPLLVYLVLVCYKEEISKSYNNFLLNIALFTSLYLCFRFGITNNNSKILLFCNIPIVIAYMKKQTSSAIALSIINIIYCYFMFNELCLVTVIKYTTYLILYICANKRKLSINGFILSIAVLQGFFLSFEYFFREVTTVAINDFIELILLVFIYYFVTFSIVYIFKVIEKVQSLNTSIKLLEKDKVIKDALFKLTHEIKNPLAVCKGYLEMIDLEQKDKTIKYISIMKQEINRSLNIMSDFLELNKIKVVKEQIDLNLILEDVYDCFKIITKSHNIKLIYKDREDEEIYFMGDYERLKQVMINLLKNSYESINDQGKIEISSNIYKNYIDIVVEDNGTGMSEETLERIKEMFYTTKPTGSGLGVALSNEIVKAHNGELIYSSELNKGTKATIRLPYQ